MMRLPKMEHVAPKSIAEACSLTEKYRSEARVLAGGTDLLVACKLRNFQPTLLVSLGDISELKGVRFQIEDGLRIGAMTSLNRVRYDSIILNYYPALAEAAAVVAAPQIQHMGTLGGNLCLNTRCFYYNQSDSWRKNLAVCFKMGGDVCHVVPKGKKCYAVFSGDTAPAMMALDAQVKLVGSHGERILPVSKIFTGDGKEPIWLKSGEVLSEVRIPPPAGKQSSTYLKYRVRGAIDFPLAGVAVRMDREEGTICKDCKIVINAVNSAPTEVPESGALLKGQKPTVDLINRASEKAVKAAHPVFNTSGATPAYRRNMVGILTRRALLSVAKRLDFNF
jgi:4-hydroxybenzoyl-CoA reductase subunit beta